MKNGLRKVLIILIAVLFSLSLASCNIKDISEDDDREEDTREETEKETEESEDETSEVTVSEVPITEEPSSPPTAQTTETSSEDYEANVQKMLPVMDAIAYVMTYESETGLYEAGNAGFAAKVLYMGTQLHGAEIFNETEDTDGSRKVSYADIEEFANACFDLLSVDITVGDEFGRLTYNEAENAFYAGLGDGMYESGIDSISVSDGVVSVLFSVIDSDSGTITAQYTFTMVANDFLPASGISRYPFSVTTVESV